MSSVRYARFLIGVSLSLAPFVCAAQEADSGSAVVTDTGALAIEHLEMFAEGALAPADLAMTDKERTAWAAEVKRYAERSLELRSRCNEEIRKSNRDTIVSKSAQCLRSDLLLEATHRRKQRDLFTNTAGVPADVIGGATTGIDAWLDAATSIVDGIDAGVFATIDSLKTAKRNLNTTYRVPMQDAFYVVRVMHVRAAMFSFAANILEAVDHAYQPPLDPIVTCLDIAELKLDPGHRAGDGGATFAEGIAELRRCIDLARELH